MSNQEKKHGIDLSDGTTASESCAESEMQWEVDRYVYGDETLDREAFEARMLHDEHLALAVADAVAEMQCLALVVEGSVEPFAIDEGQVRTARSATEGTRVEWMRWARVAAAAGLLLAVGAGVWGLQHQRGFLAAWLPDVLTSGPSAEEAALADVAENWMAMLPRDLDADQSVEQDSISEGSSAQGTEVVAEEVSGGVEIAELAGDEEDWILQTAADFFAEADFFTEPDWEAGI